MPHSHKEKTLLIETTNKEISIKRQTEILGISRSSVYYEPYINAKIQMILREVDKVYTKFPWYGSRKISQELKRHGYENIGRKKVRTCMEILGLEAIYPKPKTSRSHPAHRKYPYLLNNLNISRSNQVWGTDITYIPMHKGFLYLVAIMDWYSRFVLAWELSISLNADFCVRCLQNALSLNLPEIHNSDQGVQFTSTDYISELEKKSVQISMDARGRCFDNIFTERLWRTVKYEEVYIKHYQSVLEAKNSIHRYFNLYNYERIHESLGYKTPYEIYSGKIL